MQPSLGGDESLGVFLRREGMFQYDAMLTGGGIVSITDIADAGVSILTMLGVTKLHAEHLVNRATLTVQVVCAQRNIGQSGLHVPADANARLDFETS